MSKKTENTSMNLDGKYYQEIWVDLPTEKPIYELFFDRHGRFLEDHETGLYLGVFGLVDYRDYTKDRRNMLPRWYICISPEINHELPNNNILVELKFIENIRSGLLIQFEFRTNEHIQDTKAFVDKINKRIEEITEVKEIRTNTLITQLQPQKPWEAIPDHNWDRVALRLWLQGYMSREIATRIGVSSKRISNRISELRIKYGEDKIPKDKKRRHIMDDS